MDERKELSSASNHKPRSPPHDCAGMFSRSVHGREMARPCRMYLWMGRLLTRIASLSNSPRIRSAPKTAIVGCHLFEQTDRLGRKPRLALMYSAFMFPVHTGKLTRPSRDPSPVGQGGAPVSTFEPFWPEPPEATCPSSDRRVV